jgi:hypothetical protein
MPSHEKDIETVIPDLRDIPVERLAELGSSALAYSIALYRERLKENRIPLSPFSGESLVTSANLLPEAVFTALAEDRWQPAAMRLGEAQRSKHLMLLHAVAGAAIGPQSRIGAVPQAHPEMSAAAEPSCPYCAVPGRRSLRGRTLRLS